MKRNKGKRKGGRGKRFVGTAALLIIALFLLAFVVGKFGFGGKGDSDGESTPQTQVSSEVETGAKKTVAVSVVENDYLYNNEKLALDALVTKLKALDDICVEISNDNASLKAYDNLTKALKDNNIQYVEKKK